MSCLIERITRSTSDWPILLEPILSTSAMVNIAPAMTGVNAGYWCIPEMEKEAVFGGGRTIKKPAVLLA
jgi:hypothetical protein